MKLSIVICTYNRAQLLKGALESLSSQGFNPEDYEIIVCDDGSTDNTQDIVAGLSLRSRLRYFYQPHKSRASARNLGISQAQGDFILFVDDDILAPENLLMEHFKLQNPKKKIIVRGPVIDTPDYEIPRNPKAKVKDYSMAFFCTCNASVSRRALESLGGFDETFTEYGWEDTELGLRLRARGYKVKFNLNAIVYHYKAVDCDTLDANIEKAKELGKMAVNFFFKHPTLRVRLATGINPVQILWQDIFANKFIKDLSLNILKNEKVLKNKGLSYFLERRVFNYYYNNSIKEEFNRRRNES